MNRPYPMTVRGTAFEFDVGQTHGEISVLRIVG